jgi:hypothetical protein
LRRISCTIADSCDTVADLIGEFQPATVVADVEPLVAPRDSAASDVVSGAVRFTERLVAAAPATLSLLVFASNARLHVPEKMKVENVVAVFVSPAWKPWTVSYIAKAPRPMVVVGDQVVTDGIIAVRMQVPFIHSVTGNRVPWWPRLQAAIGTPVAKVVFRDRALSSRNAR